MAQKTEKTPLVSICCITYNHEKYIRDALEGFLMQETTFPFEVLIHDDASTDRTADIIREYEVKYPDIIKPIYQTENQYSKGIDIFQTYNFPRAKGKYIALCEGDDFWTDKHKLQIQADFMETHPDYSMCFHKAKIVDENGGTRDYFDRNEERDYSGYEMLKDFIVPTASSFFKSQWITKIPQNRDFWCGDIIIWLTLSQYGKVFCLKREMSVYRILSTGAVSTFYRTRDVDWLKRNIRHYEALKNTFSFVPSKWISAKEGECYYNCLQYLKNRRSISDACIFFIQLPLKIQMNIIFVYVKKRFVK